MNRSPRSPRSPRGDQCEATGGGPGTGTGPGTTTDLRSGPTLTAPDRARPPGETRPGSEPARPGFGAAPRPELIVSGVGTDRPGRQHRARSRALAAAVGTTATAVTVVLVIVLSGDPGGGQGKGGTSSPTVAGTSRPAGDPKLPPGSRKENGFAWVPPEGWARDAKNPSEAHYTAPDGKQEVVAKYAIAQGESMTTWENFERESHDAEGYRKIRLEETEYRGRPAVVWEYAFIDKGVDWRARQLGFHRNGKSYQVNIWYTPDTEDKALKIYDRLTDSFTPL